MKGENIMDIKAKLTSRKFWAAVAGIIVGLVVAFGGDGETVEKVAGSTMSIVSAVAYIIVEGSRDKADAGAPLNVKNLYIDTGDEEEKEGEEENETESD